MLSLFTKILRHELECQREVVFQLRPYAVSQECFCTFAMRHQQNSFKWRCFKSMSCVATWASVTSTNLTYMDCTRQLMKAIGIVVQALRSATRRSDWIIGLEHMSLSLLWISSHKFAVGFTLGLIIVWFLWCSSKSLVALGVWVRSCLAGMSDSEDDWNMIYCKVNILGDQTCRSNLQVNSNSIPSHDDLTTPQVPLHETSICVTFISSSLQLDSAICVRTAEATFISEEDVSLLPMMLMLTLCGPL